ncbi:MAG: M48 family metallopeptidase [Dehalococcoidia bacterium]|nr:M48 family metallopeptidase [Dehalococcoidia bacterium]
MSLCDGLVVVVPHRFSLRRIPGILEQSRPWLERTASQLEVKRSLMASESDAALPEHISLAAIGEEWAVEYRTTDSLTVRVLERRGNRLVLSGNCGEVAACRVALRRWLNRKGHQYLEPWLARIADELGFKVKRVVVRSQRTRWGSCSRTGTISLNVRLLFLQEEVARHVLIHELCHTSRMDHSAVFWSLVERHDPAFKAHRKRLRAAWHEVPWWVNGGPVAGVPTPG